MHIPARNCLITPPRRPPASGGALALLGCLLGLSAALPPGAAAQLTITPANVSRGFQITTFATGIPSSFSQGVNGIAFRTNHSVLFTNPNDFSLYSLPSHSDGQVVSPANLVQYYGPAQEPYGLWQCQTSGVWHYYEELGGQVFEIDPVTGNTIQTVFPFGVTAMVPYPAGLSGPLAGHMFVAGGDTLYGFNPSTLTRTAFVTDSLAFVFGMAFCPTGDTLYTSGGPAIRALAVPSGALLWDLPTVGRSYQGIAVGVGNLAGYIYVQDDLGEITEFGTPWGPHPGVDNVLAAGGVYSLLMAADPDVPSGTGGGAYPSVLIPEGDRIVRLDPPGGGWFGPPTSSLHATGSTSGVGPGEATPSASLNVSPDPSAGIATLDFSLARDGHVRIEIMDLQGRHVAELINARCGAGSHRVTWDSRTSRGSCSSGVYFARMDVEGRLTSRKIVLTR